MNNFKYYHNIIEKSKFVNSDKREVQFKNTLNRFFSEWKKQVINNLKKEMTNKEVKKALGDYKLSSITYLAANKIKSFISKLTAIATGATKQGIERSYKDMGVTIAWDINMDQIASFYEKRYEGWTSKLISEQVQVSLEQEIIDGIKNGDSIEDMSKRITEYFDHPITVPEKKDEEGNTVRKAYQINQDSYAEMFARTETSGAINNGRLAGYEESDLVKSVAWFANPGACDLCLEEQGQVYEVRKAREEEMIPKHPNCRCTWIVEEYGKYGAERDEEWPTTEKISTDPLGVHAFEWLKMTDEQKQQVKELINEDKIKESIDLMTKFTQGEE